MLNLHINPSNMIQTGNLVVSIYTEMTPNPETMKFVSFNNASFRMLGYTREEFAALLGPQGASGTVHQCGSGVTACHNLLAMTHAGLAGSVLYPGSWSQWCADPARPVAKG